MAKSAVIFISGGVRSGKSSFAENLAAEAAKTTNGQLHYIAAGQSTDPEMAERIARHQRDRLQSGLDWKTWEQPVELGEMADLFTKKDIVLLDCLTTLLNNEIFQQDDEWKKPDFQRKVMESILAGIEGIAQSCQLFIIVSNEVLNEMQGDNTLVKIYGKMLGYLHQQIVAIAKQAYLVEAGIPLLMKGSE